MCFVLTMIGNDGIGDYLGLIKGKVCGRNGISSQFLGLNRPTFWGSAQPPARHLAMGWLRWHRHDEVRLPPRQRPVIAWLNGRFPKHKAFVKAQQPTTNIKKVSLSKAYVSICLLVVGWEGLNWSLILGVITCLVGVVMIPVIVTPQKVVLQSLLKLDYWVWPNCKANKSPRSCAWELQRSHWINAINSRCMQKKTITVDIDVEI